MMATVLERLQTGLLTYDQYMAEGEVVGRYDILDGERVVMPSPVRRHQTVALNVSIQFRSYEDRLRRGKTFIAPCDVLITRAPLRTRQPNVLFISHEQLALCGSDTDSSPLEAAPDLVVEILSPSETLGMRAAKLRDYCAVGVKECWIVMLETGVVDVLRLSPSGSETIGSYRVGETVQSEVFPGLAVAVEDVLAP
ncbi:MAG: Uma2 family endonuclease [Armatimonadota bacterium]|nr:Uma2 family endonuclease [Armatimonadota bacterium]